MAADGESAGKSKDRKDRTETVDIGDLVKQAKHTDVHELETIPTKVPREGDGYLPSNLQRDGIKTNRGPRVHPD